MNDFAGSHYYRVNRILLTCLGLWPYYTQRTNYVYSTFLFLLLLSNVFFQLSSFIVKGYSVDRLLNIFSILGITLYYTVKYFAMFTNSSKVRELMEQIRYDWNTLKEKEEFKIIRHRANIGRSCTIILLIWIYTTTFVFILMLSSPSILDIAMPLNESRSLWQISVMVELFVNEEKYIGLLTFYLLLSGFIGISTMIAVETFVLMYVQHTCAMFQITSYRIERIVNNSQMKWLISPEKFSIHKSLVETVDGHQNAIESIDSLKNTFSIAHFFAIPLSVSSLSINLYLLCERVMAGDIGGTSILLLYVFSHFCYMLLCTYTGQLVIDHSDDIFKKICNTRWYEAPLSTQKCLMMITYRSMKTCTMMICLGLFVPSLPGFATLVSSSLSYFMVLYSVRRQ
ncbi:PREDICTED: odorant receptor 22c-like [Vollenhovia emeryi]|uniref:odorant receptor 22c-like n=1 Tax=Vollenhovia emeryi TaxID=411798 RepID=UPI0005F3972A|nr:PREDICTED: odorant receptor 22c-like [Vollenhovia emeryi]